MRRLYLYLLLMTAVLFGGEFDKVRITPDIDFVYVYHKGKAVKVHRIQDTKHKLTGEYAKTYRPGTHIQPIVMDPDIETIGEVEVIRFMQDKVNHRKGLIIDVRDRAHYKKEAIPSAVNIPLTIAKKTGVLPKIFKALGMRRKSDGSWDGSHAMELVVYCHGLWCKKSVQFIKLITKAGYPKEKIKYYRGGFQMWKILGFTTVAS